MIYAQNMFRLGCKAISNVVLSDKNNLFRYLLHSTYETRALNVEDIPI